MMHGLMRGSDDVDKSLHVMAELLNVPMASGQLRRIVTAGSNIMLGITPAVMYTWTISLSRIMAL